MGKLKSFVIAAAAASVPFLACTSSSAENFIQAAALISANARGEEIPPPAEEDESDAPEPTITPESTESTELSESPEIDDIPDLEDGEENDDEEEENNTVRGEIITLNRSELIDDTDYSQFTSNSGTVLRYAFGRSNASNYINLDGGGQVQNLSDMSVEELSGAAELLPFLGVFEDVSEEPQVLIYHTHTTESYYPYSDWYDSDYPTRSVDDSRNMTAVGDAICEALSMRGIAVVHDCAVHDYPQYTGSYYRSADSVSAILEQYPSIKLVLDIHRDGIAAEDGTPIAPAVEINGKSAAQFMIISGCDDDGELGIPNFIDNFKTACLLQRCAESDYPGLARAVLFDYRNYNQHLSPGSLLIEVGSQANTLEESVYTGELLGNIIASALETLENNVEIP